MNNTLTCTSAGTFRLASYSHERLIETVSSNLSCLQNILRWNVEQGILFFRITSDLVPFASHPICTFNWQEHFQQDFQSIGDFITKNNLRVSMHPDQFVLLNSPNQEIVANSIKELEYQTSILDLMGQGGEAKIQIHVGGVYGDKQKAIERFITIYKQLPKYIKRRLVIENDDRLYSNNDCLEISNKTGVPILFDTFHHELLNSGEDHTTAFMRVGETWKKEDGVPIVDYSSQAVGERKGKHTNSIDIDHFSNTIEKLNHFEFDVMLEIKDKEKSAIKALQCLS